MRRVHVRMDVVLVFHHQLRDQQLLATAVQEGLDYVLSQAAQLDELVRLGLRISRQWVYHILKGEMV